MVSNYWPVYRHLIDIRIVWDVQNLARRPPDVCGHRPGIARFIGDQIAMGITPTDRLEASRKLLVNSSQANCDWDIRQRLLFN